MRAVFRGNALELVGNRSLEEEEVSVKCGSNQSHCVQIPCWRKSARLSLKLGKGPFLIRRAELMPYRCVFSKIKNIPAKIILKGHDVSEV